MTRTPVGVGFIGAGAVTQAIHLPTLARMGDLFQVRHVFDVDEQVAQAVAARVGARASTDLDLLLADPEVQVIAVCSPDRLHAQHVIAAIEAGARAVLCEKPFATTEDDARRIAQAAQAAGVPVVVGAMHTFDGSWTRIREALDERPGTRMRQVRSSIVLPPNERFEDFATEVAGTRAARPQPSADPAPEEIAEMLRRMILGLAIHDLPLIRQLVADPEDLHVHHARLIQPFGYQILAEAGGTRLQLHASMGQPWRPDWTLTALAEDVQVSIDFTPSYVHAGSGIGRVSDAQSTTVHGPFPANGYEAEWRAIGQILDGERPAPALADLVDDLRFALAVADGARDRILHQLTQEAAA